MTRSLTLRAVFGAAALLTAGGITACGLYPDPPNAIVPPNAKPTVKTKAAGVVTDAATGAPIAGTVSVKALNPNGGAASGLLSDTGGAVNSFTVTGGLFDFQVADSVSFPKDIVLTASANGYTTGSANLHITGPGVYSVNIPLVNLNAPPAGASTIVTSAGTASSTGVLASGVGLATPAEQQTGGALTFDLPAGEKITDASGNPLTGPLTASLAFFNDTSTDSLKAFPGSTSNAVVNNGGSSTTGAFVVGAFSAIQISDAAGHQAAHFTQPVPSSLNIGSTTNPTTGAALAVGDSIPTWSYNESKGTWKPEGSANLASDGNGGLIANFTASHLTYWSVGWFLSGSSLCANGRNIAVTGNSHNVNVGYLLGTAGFLKVIASDQATVPVASVPANLPVQLEAVFNGQVVGGPVSVTDLCSGGDIPLSISLPASANSPATLTVSAFDVCEQTGNVKTPVPSTAVAVFQNGIPVLATTGADGTFTFTGLTAGGIDVYGVNRATGKAFTAQHLDLVAGANSTEFDNTTSCTVLTGSNGG